MKLAMFKIDTPVGPQSRFGVVKLDGGTDNTIEDARTNAARTSAYIEQSY